MKKYIILHREEITQTMLDESASTGGVSAPTPILETDETETGYYLISTRQEFAPSLQLFKKLTEAEYLVEVTAIQAGNAPDNKLKETQDVKNKNEQFNKVVRKGVPGSDIASHTIGSPKVKGGYLKNESATRGINVCFDNDDMATDYFNLLPGEKSERMAFSDGSKINLQRDGSGTGAAQVVIILWG